MKKILILCGVLALGGCASTGVMEIGSNRYLISDTSSTTWSGGQVYKDILQEAAKFCASQGKKVEVLNSSVRDRSHGFGITKAGADIEFTCK